jgi:hypothetical protein
MTRITNSLLLNAMRIAFSNYLQCHSEQSEA